ncbi:MAG: CDP-alcohol phosphatidyltransferase family protein [Oscillospiraceae bacterium]|nr:CDP-alcohol phosphatidyltransferase family protein [Oscillospiraceae bacterium]
MKHVPNLLSLSRIPLSLVLIPIALLKKPVLFLAVYLVTGLTDVLDGWLARRYHWESKRGAKIDASADVVLMLSLLAVIFLVLKLKFKSYVLIALGAVVALKLINLVFTKVKFRQWATMHTLANKYTALPFYVLVPVCVWFPKAPVSLLAAVMLGTVFAANLEESWILAASSAYGIDTKTIWHLKKAQRQPIEVPLPRTDAEERPKSAAAR